MIKALENEQKDRMNKAIESLSKDLSKVRTGRAQVSLLDSVKVDYYGTPSPLTQVASVSCPDARSFLIAPWDSGLLKEIESSLVKSNLGLTPQNDGKVIRLKVPELTEERRKDLVKSIKKTVEDARVAIRMVRREANEQLKVLHKNKQIAEDEQKNAMDSIQKLTDSFIEKIDKMGVDKEKELMTV